MLPFLGDGHLEVGDGFGNTLEQYGVRSFFPMPPIVAEFVRANVVSMLGLSALHVGLRTRGLLRTPPT